MGSNVMANNLNLVARNLWEIGLLIVIGEYIRFRLIKSANPLNRPVIAFALTIILAYGQMDGIRMLLGGDVILWAIFFESVFRHLIISAVVTYISIKGSLASMVLISFFYTMLPFLAPVIPDITPIAFSLISGAMAFVTGIIYHFVSNEKSQDVRKREKRVIKYGRKPILFNTGYALVLVLIGAFFVGLFPIYPIAVLTDSMEPTFERGTLVFIERVSPGEAFNKVDEGQVIHFESRNRVEFIHRVVDFSHDSDGERVYITQGDAVEIIDPHPVPQDNVLGIARASIPFLGYPYLAFRAIVGALQ
jgi:signal peptidase